MKKLATLIFLMITGASAFAQTAFPNGGMETWRTSTSGVGSGSVTVYAPTQWYGFDSLAIALIQSFGTPLHAGGAYHAQLYQEGTIIHSGNSSAKVMTLAQDTVVGVVAGSLTNASASINLAALAPLIISGGVTGAAILNATTFTGGTAVTSRITSVSAWVQYAPGIDTATHAMGGIDTALVTVQALGHTHGKYDTLVGTGRLQILPSTSFNQITVPVTYFDSVNYYIDTIRVIFSSSGGGRSADLDSSTLYVDDVSMTGVANPDFSGVREVTPYNAVTVYPNPANDMLHIETQQQNVQFVLYSISGKVVADKNISGHDVLDVSSLPAGIYAYVIHDLSGNVIKKGMVKLSR